MSDPLDAAAALRRLGAHGLPGCSDEPIAYVIETTPPLPGIPRVIWAVAGSIERAREKAAATGLPLTRHSIRPATPRTIDQEGH